MSYLYAEGSTYTISQLYDDIRTIVTREVIEASATSDGPPTAPDRVARLREDALLKMSQLPSIAYLEVKSLTPAEKEVADQIQGEQARVRAEHAIKLSQCSNGVIEIAVQAKDYLLDTLIESTAKTFLIPPPFVAAWKAASMADFALNSVPAIMKTLEACVDAANLKAEIDAASEQLRAALKTPTLGPAPGGSPTAADRVHEGEPRRRGSREGEQASPDIIGIGEGQDDPSVFSGGRRPGKGSVNKSAEEGDEEFWKQELPRLLKDAASMPDKDILAGSRVITSMWLYHALSIAVDERRKRRPAPPPPPAPQQPSGPRRPVRPDGDEPGGTHGPRH